MNTASERPNIKAEWLQSFSSLSHSGLKPLTEPLRVSGSVDIIVGPRSLTAAVILNLHDSQSGFDADLGEWTSQGEVSDFAKAAIFGFMDVTMVSERQPFSGFHVSIADLKIDPVNSCIVAFRLAGREAGKRFLEVCSERNLRAFQNADGDLFRF